MTKSTFLHLRIPFSFFLLPIFLFAWAINTKDIMPIHFWMAFFLIHFFLYPASNAYNSYFDKDEKSIGGLKHPPKVSRELYTYAILFDVVAIIGAILLLNWEVAIMFFIYGLASKAYSHPSIRLKKYPYVSWLIAGFFQGYFTFLMTYIALHNISILQVFIPFIQLPAILSSLMLLGSYPMTQIYQHEEDAKRGDITLSLKLGTLGTFHFTTLAFGLATVGFVTYFMYYFSFYMGIFYLLFLMPILLFFSTWYFKVRKDQENANFENTMRLNFLSGLMLNLFFIFLGIYFL